jgi:hypothetical protein
VKAEAAVADVADAAVEAFQAPVGEAEAAGGEDAGAVATDRARELDERDQPRPRCPCEPGVQVRGREAGIVELVEQPQLFLSRKAR